MPIISFDATDGVGGSGVAATYASLDGVPVTSFPIYVTTQGLHQVRYLSQDAADNIEPMRTALVCVDTSAPSVLLSANTTYTGAAEVSASATDHYSGVGHIEMRIDGGPWQSVTSVATSTPGPHWVDARAFDLAGNEGDTSSAFTVLASAATTTQLSCAARVRVKSVLKLSGTVCSSAAPGAVDLTVSRRVGGTWRKVATIHARFAQGYWTCSYRPTATGSWRFVATYLGGTTDTVAYRSSRSAVRTVNTTR
jgi:hypothetical protein